MNLIWPVPGGENKISQKFGGNPDGYPDYYSKFGFPGHNGIDIAGFKGTPVRATIDILIGYAAWDATGFGNLAVGTDATGRKHYFAHLDMIAVKVGDQVKQGQVIGTMGNTGNVISGPYSDGTHLHYGIRLSKWDKNDPWKGWIDPLPLLNAADVSIPAPTAVTAESESAAGWAEIVNEWGANVRTGPAVDPAKTWLPKGVRVYKIGRASVANGLVWEEISGGLFVARTDSAGTVLLQDVEGS